MHIAVEDLCPGKRGGGKGVMVMPTTASAQGLTLLKGRLFQCKAHRGCWSHGLTVVDEEHADEGAAIDKELEAPTIGMHGLHTPPIMDIRPNGHQYQDGLHVKKGQTHRSLTHHVAFAGDGDGKVEEEVHEAHAIDGLEPVASA